MVPTRPGVINDTFSTSGGTGFSARGNANYAPSGYGDNTMLNWVDVNLTAGTYLIGDRHMLRFNPVNTLGTTLVVADRVLLTGLGPPSWID